MTTQDDKAPFEVIEGGRYQLEEKALRAIWLSDRDESQALLRRLTTPANSTLQLVNCGVTDAAATPAPESERSG